MENIQAFRKLVSELTNTDPTEIGIFKMPLDFSVASYTRNGVEFSDDYYEDDDSEEPLEYSEEAVAKVWAYGDNGITEVIPYDKKSRYSNYDNSPCIESIVDTKYLLDNYPNNKYYILKFTYKYRSALDWKDLDKTSIYIAPEYNSYQEMLESEDVIRWKSSLN